MEKSFKQYKLGRIRHIAIWISVTVISWRSELSNLSLVLLHRLKFVKKMAIIDGANKVEKQKIKEATNSNLSNKTKLTLFDSLFQEVCII